jgi:hypothetical protein
LPNKLCKTTLAAMVLSGALAGCVSPLQNTTQSPKVVPYPTEQEIQQDLYHRQHEVACSELQRKIWNRQGADMLAKAPLDKVNNFTPEETPQAVQCGSKLVHLQHVEVKHAVGCVFGWGGGSDGLGFVSLAGPNNLYYNIITSDERHGNISRPPSELVLGHYYKVTYWEWTGTWDEVPDKTSHIIDIINLGKCQ